MLCGSQALSQAPLPTTALQWPPLYPYHYHIITTTITTISMSLLLPSPPQPMSPSPSGYKTRGGSKQSQHHQWPQQQAGPKERKVRPCAQLSNTEWETEVGSRGTLQRIRDPRALRGPG